MEEHNAFYLPEVFLENTEKYKQPRNHNPYLKLVKIKCKAGIQPQLYYMFIM